MKNVKFDRKMCLSKRKVSDKKNTVNGASLIINNINAIKEKLESSLRQ